MMNFSNVKGASIRKFSFIVIIAQKLFGLLFEGKLNMSKFKKGDKVKIVKTGFGFGTEHLGKIVTISKKGSSYLYGIDGYYIDEGVGNGARSSTCGAPSFELLLYPNPPHKHAELIRAWADGAEIEYHYAGQWFPLDKSQWLFKSAYRIKPTKSAKDIKLEELEANMRKLADEIKELRDE